LLVIKGKEDSQVKFKLTGLDPSVLLLSFQMFFKRWIALSPEVCALLVFPQGQDTSRCEFSNMLRSCGNMIKNQRVQNGSTVSVRQ
jgi:hypothetical protein